MSCPPAITIHSLEQARHVLAGGRPVTLLSAPAAAVYAGPAWWRAVIDASGTAGPDLLDCSDAPGRALEALALGCTGLILYACPAWDNVAERAGRVGATILAERPRSLDLADPGALRRIADWLEVG